MTAWPTQVLILARLRRELARRAAREALPADVRLAAQARRVAELRRWATQHSPFYAERHAGLEHAPLDQLPVVTKAALMERFDEVVTDRRMRRADLQAFVEGYRPGQRHRGHWVAMTSGSTGVPGLFAYDLHEWIAVIARSAQGRALAGPLPGRPPDGRPRSARVGSPAPSHLAGQITATLKDPRKPSLWLDATAPVQVNAGRLQSWQPHVLAGPPSVLTRLADEQLAGRLAISPRRVFSSSEVLTPDTRDRLRQAWSGEPFDHYAAVEAGTLAAECGAHTGLHVLDDHLIEVVDEAGRPMPPGETGAKALLTVLTSRTVPLIRYELTDRLQVSAEPCPCGRELPLLTAVHGRTRHLVPLPGRTGEAAVHPLVLTRVLDKARVAGWQVAVEASRLVVRVTGPRPGFEAEQLRGDLVEALAGADVTGLPVEVLVVPVLARHPDGTLPLVVGADGTSYIV